MVIIQFRVNRYGVTCFSAFSFESRRYIYSMLKTKTKIISDPIRASTGWFSAKCPLPFFGNVPEELTMILPLRIIDQIKTLYQNKVSQSNFEVIFHDKFAKGLFFLLENIRQHEFSNEVTTPTIRLNLRSQSISLNVVGRADFNLPEQLKNKTISIQNRPWPRVIAPDLLRSRYSRHGVGVSEMLDAFGVLSKIYPNICFVTYADLSKKGKKEHRITLTVQFPESQ